MEDKRIIRNENENPSSWRELELSIDVCVGTALKELVKRVRQNESLKLGWIEFNLSSIRVIGSQLYLFPTCKWLM